MKYCFPLFTAFIIWLFMIDCSCQRRWLRFLYVISWCPQSHWYHSGSTGCSSACFLFQLQLDLRTTRQHRQHETEASYSKCQHVLLWRPREAVKHSSALKWHWPDLGPFSVEVPQTLVLRDSRLFLIGPESWAGFETSRRSSKEETIHSLLSSRSVYCQQVHCFSIMDHF